MTTQRRHQLIEIEWPEFGTADVPNRPDAAELQTRIDAVRHAMKRDGLSHMMIYGDREHFANLTYLTNFDPRFEEALLIIGHDRTPLLLVGNECEGYLPVCPQYVTGDLRAELYQPFSLLNQVRDKSRTLREIFVDEGVGANSAVGCAGWKYFSDEEERDSRHVIEIPAFIVDNLRALTSFEQVTNATAILMNPADGLRAICSPTDIAYFEYSNVLASEAMKRMIFGMREGMSDHEVAQLARTNGMPLGCHPTLATGDHWPVGLYSATGQTLRRGVPLSANICYWGSNSCRSGWLASSAADLPAGAQDYVENFAGPYIELLGDWFEMMRIGTLGGDIAALVAERLPFDKFGVFLNPGHLIHLDEWVSSPIYAGSTIPLQSGMVFQVDIIPFSKTYGSTRMEDGIVLADAALQAELTARYPAMMARCHARRAFMQDVLGIQLPDEILPLSNTPGIVTPFFFAPQTVFALQ